MLNPPTQKTENGIEQVKRSSASTELAAREAPRRENEATAARLDVHPTQDAERLRKKDGQSALQPGRNAT